MALAIGSTIFINVNPQLPIKFKYANYKSLFDLPENFTVLSHSDQSPAVITQPQRLQLKSPAQCNNDSNVCDIPDIMLGKEINIPASVIGYNNESSEAAKVLISCVENCDGHKVKGDKLILIGDKFSGISITGANMLQDDFIISIQLTGVDTALKISVNIHLIPCYLGYEYNTTTEQCHCFKKNDIISCTDHTTIKRNFWFGAMKNVTTTSRCPNGFCNFAQADISSGRIYLPLKQDDQCDSHRTGPACGNCDDGYTIPFDSVECINVDKCTTWKTVLVVACTVLYWLVVVILCFVIMYFQVSIGYLYGIIYYYSVTSNLLGVILDLNDSLDTFATVLLSITRVTPKFLSGLCFVKRMSGIDLQAIHYVHPFAFLLIILLCVKIARHSTRFTMLISPAIIHVICLLLTLVYTSIADASLQLFRYIHFMGIKEAYCYWSPDFQYLTDRHITYFILAVLFELIIGIGLPLLLLLEPFVNHRINFTRIKPLLDQFQGCYKDNCRWFAAIYFLCRQVILIIVVINFEDYYVELYLLISASLVMSFLHYTFQPYNNDSLNKYDGLILHLQVLVVSLQMVVFSSGFSNDVITIVAYVLLTLPITSYIVLIIFLKWQTVIRFIRAVFFCFEPNNEEVCENTGLLSAAVAKPEQAMPTTSSCCVYQESLFAHADKHH